MKNLSRYSLLAALTLAASPFIDAKPARKATAAKEEKHAYKEVKTEEEFSDAIAGAIGKVVVAKFYADWCSFCVKMKPEFEKAATGKSKNDAVFLSVNTDKLPDLARTFKVKGLPTTVFIKTKTGFMTADDLDKEISQISGKAFGTKTTVVPTPAEAPAAPAKAPAKKAARKS